MTTAAFYGTRLTSTLDVAKSLVRTHHFDRRCSMTESTLLTPEEVSDFLKVPVRTLYSQRYRKVGPPAIRVGRHLRYRRRDIEEWLTARTSVGASA
jgi:excisionase family DNA binding protein